MCDCVKTIFWSDPTAVTRVLDMHSKSTLKRPLKGIANLDVANLSCSFSDSLNKTSLSYMYFAHLKKITESESTF